MAKPKTAPYEVEHYRFVKTGNEKYDVVREFYATPIRTEVIDRNVSLPVARADVRRRQFAALENREFKGEM